MTPFTIEANQYLTQEIQGFYHTDFGGVNLPNNPNYLYKLKNDPHHNWSDDWIRQAQEQLLRVLLIDLPEVQNQIHKNPLTICVIPRAKADNTYNQNQLLFKATVRNAVIRLGNSFIDGTNFIQRHTNTKTTHLRQPIDGYNNDGANPYIGITNATCNISNNVIGKNILLIDDIYTRTVNIDEDAIQALISKGANSVSFYAIGKTVFNH
jgi:predicted amidophosphoribosyltransferase